MSEGTEMVNHLRYATLQYGANEWAAEVYLDPFRCDQLTSALAGIFGLPEPLLFWEMADAIDGDAGAITFRRERTGSVCIAFAGLGTTLLTLCHELTHAWRPWEEDFHNEEDWDITTILLEECRALV